MHSGKYLQNSNRHDEHLGGLHAAGPRAVRITALFAWMLSLSSLSLFGQAEQKWQRTVAASIAEPVLLEVNLSRADLQIFYSHEGEVTVTAVRVSEKRTDLAEIGLSSYIIFEQTGNHITLRDRASSSVDQSPRITYRIDVPYRTVVRSHVDHGNQTILGITGPVNATSGSGAITASYVSETATAETGEGDLALRVIGGRARAVTRKGNISCDRAAQGVEAETADGDITLMVVGPSKASVSGGTGKIEAGGVRGALVASTVAGDIHVRAVPHGDWQLQSATGSVSVELPPNAGFDLDASTDSGTVSIRRGDLPKAAPDARSVSEKANGGGKRIVVGTGSGRIVIG
jgi:hypothetical protein